MIFYLLHNIINTFVKDWSESKKNCFTFVIGGTLYVLLYVFLEYLSKITGNLFITLLHKFYLYFIVIDTISMAILYKNYFGRSIFTEIDPFAESEWTYDENTNRYKRNKDISIEEMRKFNESSKGLKDLEVNIDDIRENILDLDKKTEEISEAVLYHPNSEYAKELEKDFNSKL